MTSTLSTSTNWCKYIAKEGVCYDHVMFILNVGMNDKPEWYPNLDENSTFVDVQLHLFETGGEHNCPHPCIPWWNSTVTTTSTSSCCCVAQKNETCYADVEWAMQIGIHSQPDAYPGLNATSSFVSFQEALFNRAPNGNCPHPCIEPTTTTPCPFLAEEGSECWKKCMFAKNFGIYQSPSTYLGLNPNSTFEDFQTFFYFQSEADCTLPCEFEESSALSLVGTLQWLPIALLVFLWHD